jgi:hypothetical protein
MEDEMIIKEIMNAIIYAVEACSNEFFILDDNKSITFSEEDNINIIPNRDFIIENNLKDELWYSGIDFYKFRMEATQEIQKFMMYSGLDFETSCKRIWKDNNYQLISSIIEDYAL